MDEYLFSCLHDMDVALWNRAITISHKTAALWEQPRLHWFTDHGFGHSSRVISRIGEIVKPLQHTAQALNPHELFVLIAATLLHEQPVRI